MEQIRGDFHMHTDWSDGRDSLGRYYNYPPAEWLEATYAAAGAWTQVKSDTSVIKSFDEAPANMLHLVVRRPPITPA